MPFLIGASVLYWLVALAALVLAALWGPLAALGFMAVLYLVAFGQAIWREVRRDGRNRRRDADWR